MTQLYSFPTVRRHPERDYEDQVLAYLKDYPGIKDVARQVSIRGHGVADIVFYAEIEDDAEREDGIGRIIGVVEVKAIKAGEPAFRQMLRYMTGLNAEFGDRATIAGILAAPRFEPWIEEYAAEPDNSFGIFRL